MTRADSGEDPRFRRLLYPFPSPFDILLLVGLTTEVPRWLFPIRSLLPSLAFPAALGSTRSPFLLDPESLLRVVLLSFRSLTVGKKLYVGNLTYNVNES